MVTKASALLSDTDRGRVEAAIRAAEAKTSGELVVVLATRSGRYDRGEDLFGVVCAAALVSLGWWLWQGTEPRTGDWVSGWAPAMGLGTVLGCLVLGFVLGTFLATVFPTLGMLFVPRREMLEEVERAAALAFQRFRVRGTDQGTGILIYCTLLERMAWVVGDATIAAQLEPAAWFNVRDAVVDGFRARTPAAGLCTAVERAGELLAQHFPLKAGDRNELPDTLRFVD
jgi:putative membrane protein